MKPALQARLYALGNGHGAWLQAAALFALTTGFYLFTLQPSLAWGDGTKLQLEAITGESFFLSALPGNPFAHDPYPFAKLGVAAWDHPLYVMLGHTVVRLVPGMHTPWLVNLLSAVFGAGALGVLFLISLEYTRSLPAALLAALAVGVSHTFWFHSVTPEVYTLFAFLLLLSLYLFGRYEATGRFAPLVFSLFCFGLAAANHLLALLAVPAFALYWSWTARPRRSLALTPPRLALLAMAFLAGYAPFLFQLIRMLRVFTIAETLGPVIGSVFLQELLSTTPRQLLEGMLNYLMFLVYQFNPILLLAGIYGLLRGFQVSSPLWRKLVAFYLVFTIFGIFYRVTDQFAFFLTSHLFFGLAIALGVARLTPLISRPRRPIVMATLGVMALSMPLFYSRVPQIAEALGVQDSTLGIPQVGTNVRNGVSYYIDPNKRADVDAYRFGNEFFLQAPENALVIAEWYTDTDEFFVLRYFSVVESRRPDLEIIGWPTMNPFYFDSQVVVGLVEDEIERRPVFLASLSDEFYSATYLAEKYCIVPELNLYRVYPASPGSPEALARPCLPG